MPRALAYYVVAVVALSAFGCEVCPHIAGLGAFSIAGLFATFFTFAALARWPLERWFVDAAPPFLRARRQFVLELGLFLMVGATLTVVTGIVYGFPPGSGLRVSFGCATIGVFAALDLALARERKTLESHAAQTPTNVQPEQYFSLSRTFVGLALSLLLLVAVDLQMMVVRELSLLASVSADDLKGTIVRLTIESAVATLVLMALTANVLIAYARTLRAYLGQQQRVLERVAAGNLDAYVPVAARNEFGVIAAHTNRMIDGLKERDQIRATMGKLVSPAVARRLLQTGTDGLALGGRRQHVVVLFSDIRGFTTWAERAEAECVVRDLNRYFSEMVALVHQSGGVVDKFIGDGLMAIFGLDDPDGAAGRAVAVAERMHEAVHALSSSLSAPIEIGIGIHAGPVIAGNIGSPERLEFTFIGDTVNTASRLEALTRELGVGILVSDAVHAALGEGDRRKAWQSMGARVLKGKSEGVVTWGLQRGRASRAA